MAHIIVWMMRHHSRWRWWRRDHSIVHAAHSTAAAAHSVGRRHSRIMMRMVMVVMMHGIIIWRWHARMIVVIVHTPIIASIIVVAVAHAFAAIHAVTPSISAIFF